MKVLIVGSDGRGSWQMRGVQLGAALLARVTLKPTKADWLWADVVVLVKRATIEYRYDTRTATAPLAWDVLDYWDQPEQNDQPAADLARQVFAIRDRFEIATLIGATEAMANDIGGVYLPHHCRIGLTPTPPRDKSLIVGYDGTKKYLGKWLKSLIAACESLGLEFVIHPPDLREVDVLVSFRDGKWDGDVCRQWKSGVKYVNAICAGRPVLTQPAAAFSELKPVGEAITDPSELVSALERVTSQTMREIAYQDGVKRAASFTVEAVAKQYVAILQNALKVAA